MNPTRQNQSFLRRWEEPALKFIVSRLHRSITPDNMTMLGVLGGFVVLFAGIAVQIDSRFLWLVNAGIILHWLGDSLDGTLARERRIERPRYGFFIDQMTDVVTNFLIALGIAASGYARFDIVLLVLIGYQMLSMSSLIQSVSTGNFLVAINGFGPTEMRALIITMNTLVFFFGAPPMHVFGIEFRWTDCFMLAGFMLMLCLFAHGFIEEGRRLNAEEPRRTE